VVWRRSEQAQEWVGQWKWKRQQCPGYAVPQLCGDAAYAFVRTDQSFRFESTPQRIWDFAVSTDIPLQLLSPAVISGSHFPCAILSRRQRKWKHEWEWERKRGVCQPFKGATASQPFAWQEGPLNIRGEKVYLMWVSERRYLNRPLSPSLPVSLTSLELRIFADGIWTRIQTYIRLSTFLCSVKL